MRDSPGAVMIFAAGFGTRMGALTADRPKPLIEIGDRSLLDRTLDVAAAAGTGRIVVNAHYLADQIEHHLQDTDTTVVVEAPRILDTGGGLKNALPALGSDTVFTLNSDAVWSGPNPLKHLATAWEPERMEALLLLLPPENVRGRTADGDFDIGTDGGLTRKGPMTYSGAQIIRTEGLAEIQDQAFSLNLLWDRMIARGKLFGITYPGHWCDVGHPGGIVEAAALLGVPNV